MRRRSCDYGEPTKKVVEIVRNFLMNNLKADTTQLFKVVRGETLGINITPSVLEAILIRKKHGLNFSRNGNGTMTFTLIPELVLNMVLTTLSSTASISEVHNFGVASGMINETKKRIRA